MSMREKIERILGGIATLAVCVIAFLFIYNANRFTGYTGDDFLYHFVYRGAWPTKDLSEYHNLWDWLVALHTHMTQWNARLTSILFEIAAMQIDKSLFNIISSLVYVGLGFMINVLASGKRAFFRPLPLALTFALMWFCLPGFGSTILWVSGASNYLFPSLLILIFFAFYRFNYQVKKHPQIMFYAMIVFAVLVGMSNEVGSSTAMIVTLLFVLYNRKLGSDNDNMMWQIFALAAGMIAFIAMISLSSASAESSNYGETLGFLEHIQQIFQGTLNYSGTLLLGILVFLLILWFNRRSMLGKERPEEMKRTLYGGLFFLVAGLAGCGAMIISPILPARLWFMVNLFLLVSFVMLLTGWQDYRERHFTTNIAVTISLLIVLFFAIPSYQTNLNNIKKSFDVFSTHERIAKESKEKHEKITKMPGMEPTTNPYNPYDGTPYITPGTPSKQWVNVWMAKYWGLHEVELDNAVPVQHSSQKDLPFVAWVEKTYNKTLGEFQKKHYPVENKVVTKKETTKSTKEENPFGTNPKPNNKNLPKNKPWLRNALIRYVDVENKKIVGVEQITSPYNEKYDISHASTSGYETLTNNPKSYTFTKEMHQTIDISVKPRSQAITIYFNKEVERNRKKETERVSTETIRGKTGESVSIHAPIGYTINGKSETAFVFPKENKGIKDIKVEKIPLIKLLKQMKALHLLLIALLLFLIYDFILGLSVGDKEAKERLRM